MKLLLAAIALSGVTIAASSCQQQARGKALPAGDSTSSHVASRDAGHERRERKPDPGEPDSGAGATAESLAGGATGEGSTTLVGSWGIAITVPPYARSEHEAHAGRHSVYLSDLVSVTLHRVDLPAPASLSEALRAWDGDEDMKNLGEGVTPNGVFYGVRTFRVRVGVPTVPGQFIHRWKQVSRVYAVLGLDQGSRVSCTGYVERGVDTADDPDLQAVRAICLSMRKRSAIK
jgi:hypothetical protein